MATAAGLARGLMFDHCPRTCRLDISVWEKHYLEQYFPTALLLSPSLLLFLRHIHLFFFLDIPFCHFFPLFLIFVLFYIPNCHLLYSLFSNFSFMRYLIEEPISEKFLFFTCCTNTPTTCTPAQNSIKQYSTDYRKLTKSIFFLHR